MPKIEERNRVLLKVILIGNSNVGKTALINHSVNKRFAGNTKATIGADFLTKEMYVDETHVLLQIWDTAGLERFRALSVAYYRGADCCVLVYDVTCMESFRNLTFWHNDFFSRLILKQSANFPLFVIGNKIDCIKDRVVSREKAQQWCKLQNNAIYYETSAKNGENIEAVFKKIATKGLRQNKQAISLTYSDQILLRSHKRRKPSPDKCKCQS